MAYSWNKDVVSSFSTAAFPCTPRTRYSPATSAHRRSPCATPPRPGRPTYRAPPRAARAPSGSPHRDPCCPWCSSPRPRSPRYPRAFVLNPQAGAPSQRAQPAHQIDVRIEHPCRELVKGDQTPEEGFQTPRPGDQEVDLVLAQRGIACSEGLAIRPICR